MVSLLRDRDQRARLIEMSDQIQVPRPRARERYDFADVDNAPKNITADDFKPKKDDAVPLAPTNGRRS